MSKVEISKEAKKWIEENLEQIVEGGIRPHEFPKEIRKAAYEAAHGTGFLDGVVLWDGVEKKFYAETWKPDTTVGDSDLVEVYRVHGNWIENDTSYYWGDAYTRKGVEEKVCKKYKIDPENDAEIQEKFDELSDDDICELMGSDFESLCINWQLENSTLPPAYPYF